MSKPTLDLETEQAAGASLKQNAVLYVGGGNSARRTTQCTAEALEIPVAHTLRGKGSLRTPSTFTRHDRLLGTLTRMNQNG
jgi:thiamine pyrophosphate-dependent acetolactate synthase large subunit-like protein